MNFLTFFLFGLSFSSGPCLTSCGPVFTSYVLGTKKNILNSLYAYVLFSLSRISAYLVIGLFFFFLGELLTDSFLQGISRYVFILGGSFIVIMGILMILSVRLESKACPAFIKNFLLRDKKNILILGLIIGFLPCAPLFAVFSSTILVSNNWGVFLLHLLFFGLGTLLSPLLLIVFFAGFIPKFFLNKKPVYARILNMLCGIIMLVLGSQLIMKAWGIESKLL